MTQKDLQYESRAAIRALEKQIDTYYTIVSRLRKGEIIAMIIPELDEDDITNYKFMPTEGNKLYPPFKEQSEGN